MMIISVVVLIERETTTTVRPRPSLSARPGRLILLELRACSPQFGFAQAGGRPWLNRSARAGVARGA